MSRSLLLGNEINCKVAVCNDEEEKSRSVCPSYETLTKTSSHSGTSADTTDCYGVQDVSIQYKTSVGTKVFSQDSLN